MAHNLYHNAKSREHSFLSVKEKAWCGLYKVFEDHPTTAEVIKMQVWTIPLKSYALGVP